MMSAKISLKKLESLAKEFYDLDPSSGNTRAVDKVLRGWDKMHERPVMLTLIEDNQRMAKALEFYAKREVTLSRLIDGKEVRTDMTNIFTYKAREALAQHKERFEP